LIELLIVVAIIAILAAIAIPNFLEAQTRAKVARVQSDFRNMKTCMFAYRVDFDWWPESEDGAGGDHSTLMNLTELSTPVAYMSSVPYQDPFSTTKYNIGGGGYWVPNHYQYYLWKVPGEGYVGEVDYLGGGSKDNNGVAFVDWTITCVGPTQKWPPGFAWGLPYDPSNGTMSYGTLWVSDYGIFGD
jgi:type II secretory pathway pseudopilin PulG